LPVISIGRDGGLSVVATPGNLRTRDIESAPPIKSRPVKRMSRNENNARDIPSVAAGAGVGDADPAAGVGDAEARVASEDVSMADPGRRPIAVRIRTCPRPASTIIPKKPARIK